MADATESGGVRKEAGDQARQIEDGYGTAGFMTGLHGDCQRSGIRGTGATFHSVVIDEKRIR